MSVEGEEERKIPVFTVTKNGAILKNIFVVNQSEGENRDGEEILTVGRHPDCHVMLTHPSISRFHLQILSNSSAQKLSVIDLASVHGTWVSEKKLEAKVPMELNEGDTIRVGSSTRRYRLHWVPLSQAYDMDTTFVSPLNSGLVQESETNENEDLVSVEAGNSEVRDLSVVEGNEEQTCEDMSSFSTNIKKVMVEDSLAAEKNDQEKDSMTLPDKAIQSLDSILDGIVALFSDGNCCLPSGIELVDSSVPAVDATSASGEQQFIQADLLPCHCSMTDEIYEEEIHGILLKSEEEEVSAAWPSDTEEVLNDEGSKDEHLQENDNEIRDYNGGLTVNLSLEQGKVFHNIDTEKSVGKGDRTLESLTGLQQLPSEGENKENLLLSVTGEGVLNIISEQVDEENHSQLPLTALQSLWENENQENLPSLVLRKDISKIDLKEMDKENQTPESLANLQLLSENYNQINHSSVMLGENLLMLEYGQTDREIQTPQPLTGMETQLENENQENFPAEQNTGLLVNLNTACVIEEGGKPAVEEFAEADQSLPREDHIEKEMSKFDCGVDHGSPAVQMFEEAIWSPPVEEFAEADQSLPRENHIEKEMSKFDCGVDHGCPAVQMFEEAIWSPPKKDQEEQEVQYFGGVKEAEFVNSSLPVEVLSETEDNKENQTPQSFHAPSVLHDAENFESDKRSGIWSRRGKLVSVPQIQTDMSERKTIGDPENSDDIVDVENRSIVRTLFSHLDNEMEEEAYTPNKENYSPNTLVLKSLKRKGKLEEIKNSMSGRNVALGLNIQQEEDLSGFSDKENQTPKVLSEKKPVKLASRKQEKSSVKRKTGRLPFQSLLEDSAGKSRSESSVVRDSSMKRQTERLPFQSLLEDSAGKSTPQSSGVQARTNQNSSMKRKTERLPFQSLLEDSASKSGPHSSVVHATRSQISVHDWQPMEKATNSSSSGQQERWSWTMLVDVATLLDKDSRKALQLLQGVKGTQLVIPRMVIRELNNQKQRAGLFRRTTEVTSALEWIEECMVKTNWWIHIQSSAELTAVPPTPPASPLPPNSDGFASWGAFSWHTSLSEIVSPAAEDHILDYSLLYRKMNGGQLVLLSNDVTLKIKAIAEGLICETAQEFRESLVNPFSERFLWAQSSPRGLTWSHLDDVVLRERYSRCPFKKQSKGGEAVKGLKLILLHNSNYAHMKSLVR